MADEITYSLFLSLANSNRAVSRATGNLTIDQTGTDYVSGTMNVATSAEAIPKGDITTPGMMLVHNLEAKGGNYVEIGHDDGGFKVGVKVSGGRYGLFECAQAVPQWKADTAAVDVEYIMLEA